MASSSKQQKRAKRAATKARENRVARNNVSKKEETPPSIDEFFDTSLDAGLYEELFAEMEEAEETSLTELCRVFLEDSLLAAVVSTYDEDDAADYIFGVLCEYRYWQGSPDEDEAIAWIQSPEFLEAYQEASKIIEAGIGSAE